MLPSRSSALVLALALAGCPGTRTAGTPKCPRDRTVTLTSQEDVEKLAGCTTLSGLTIRSGATIQLGPLRALETITGDLIVGPTVGVEELSLTELRDVGGSIQVMSNGSLRGLFLPRLERAGRISIEGNSSLVTISLPRLVSVLGSFVITEDASLELVDLSVLASVGKDLVITRNPELILIEADKLAQVLEVRIEENRKLPTDQSDALRAKSPPP
ncbi:MAG: hypothetical protein JWP01_18 [Myxococcales bacterium]|nr:hypothetical protein [Myxococcales bacterium]